VHLKPRFRADPHRLGYLIGCGRCVPETHPATGRWFIIVNIALQLEFVRDGRVVERLGALKDRATLLMWQSWACEYWKSAFQYIYFCVGLSGAQAEPWINIT
jgi:hypothetical protein